MTDPDTTAPDDRPSRSGVRRHARRIVVLVVGITLLVLGVAMIALPGPAFLVVPAALAVLATEFETARRAQRWLVRKVRRSYSRLKGRDHVEPASDGAHQTDPRTPPAL